MQSFERKTEFYFQAGANALGGALREPIEALIPSQASVALPAVGGIATARTQGFNHEGIVACSSTFTRVLGRHVKSTTLNRTPQTGEATPPGEPAAVSVLVTAVVEGLNILDVLTAERIVSQISVDCFLNGNERRISVVGSQFVGLRVAGVDVVPELNFRLLQPKVGQTGLNSLHTWHDFKDEGLKQAETLLKASEGGSEREGFQWALSRYQWMVNAEKEAKERGTVNSGGALCSLIDGVNESIPGRAYGHVIDVPGLARFVLGEVLVHPASIQLTMVHAELGCNVSGCVSVGVAQNTGHTVPPVHNS